MMRQSPPRPDQSKVCAFCRFRRKRLLSSLVSVDLLDSMAARRGAVGNASLTILFLVVHTSEVWTVAYEGRVWWFDCVVGLVGDSPTIAAHFSKSARSGAPFFCTPLEGPAAVAEATPPPLFNRSVTSLW